MLSRPCSLPVEIWPEISRRVASDRAVLHDHDLAGLLDNEHATAIVVGIDHEVPVG